MPSVRLYLCGERTHTGDVGDDIDWYGLIASPPHFDSSFPRYPRSFQVFNYCMHTVLKLTNLGKHK